MLYLGKRRMPAGGRQSDSSDAGEEEVDDDAEQTAADKPPINYHCLPVSLVMDFVKGHQVRHVVDFTPTPLPLPLELVKEGVRYFAVCGSEFQCDWIQARLDEALLCEITNPASPLHDSRLTPATAEPAPPAPPPSAAAGSPAGESDDGEDPADPPAAGWNLNVALHVFLRCGPVCPHAACV